MAIADDEREPRGLAQRARDLVGRDGLGLLLERLADETIDRFCQRVLTEVSRLTTDTTRATMNATWRCSNCSGDGMRS